MRRRRALAFRTRGGALLGPAGLLCAALLCAACGGGPQLTNLRCRVDPCQDPEKPFTLRLSVDFSDGSGTLSQGALELRVNGNTQSALSLADLFSAQLLSATSTSGTLQFDQDVSLDKVTQAESFTTSVVARDGQGRESNEPQLGFKLTLGGL
jgi:hypothetical protein